MANGPVSALDVAAYILHKLGGMTAMKLQKLVYYSQAWSLVWDETVLFKEKIEAWANGPVVRELFELHRGRFRVSQETFAGGDPDKLAAEQKETVDAVLEYYGEKSSQWLSDLTHMEDPWKLARRGLADDQRGDREITLDSMMEYYSGLQPHECSNSEETTPQGKSA